jgi:hypothetical protein
MAMDMGEPPLLTCSTACTTSAGGMFLSRYPDAPARRESKINLLSS